MDTVTVTLLGIRCYFILRCRVKIAGWLILLLISLRPINFICLLRCFPIVVTFRQAFFSAFLGREHQSKNDNNRGRDGQNQPNYEDGLHMAFLPVCAILFHFAARLRRLYPILDNTGGVRQNSLFWGKFQAMTR